MECFAQANSGGIVNDAYYEHIQALCQCLKIR